jgi:hypothetical protein
MVHSFGRTWGIPENMNIKCKDKTNHPILREKILFSLVTTFTETVAGKQGRACKSRGRGAARLALLHFLEQVLRAVHPALVPCGAARGGSARPAGAAVGRRRRARGMYGDGCLGHAPKPAIMVE